MNDNEPLEITDQRLLAAIRAVSRDGKEREAEFHAMQRSNADAQHREHYLRQSLSNFESLPSFIALLYFVAFLLLAVCGPVVVSLAWHGHHDFSLISIALALLMLLLAIRRMEKEFGTWRVQPGFKLEFVPKQASAQLAENEERRAVA